MKLDFIAAAIVASAFTMPAFAQDKPVTEGTKAGAPKAQTNTPSKRHSHMEDRQGIKPADHPAEKSAPMDKTKHYHPRDK